ncbi:hypothetical protein ABPG72_002061 [Tetrahymena utriculariae]
MNWEELIYKLNYLKIERDNQIEQFQQLGINQKTAENQTKIKHDIFQDSINPFNYIVPFDKESSSSENIDFLEAQQNEQDSDEEDQQYDQDEEDEDENEQEEEQYLNQIKTNQNIKQNNNNQNAQKMNKIQLQFFEDFDDKENNYCNDLNKNEFKKNFEKNSDYYPVQKNPLEQIEFQAKQNIQYCNTQKQKINHNQAQILKKEQDNLLDLNQFNIYTTLGTGSFGRVKLAKLKGNEKDVFALKMMKKIEIVKLKQVDHIKSEKKILSQIKHPFLVELKGTFQDEIYIYMLFEFVSGGEIFSRLRKEGRFSNDISLFYITEIYLALQYLHSQNIVYRDLKPENLLIDKEGHVKIADFGFAKIMDSARTYTLCGTPEYLAPEIIQGAQIGYGKSVDWWALGVLIFEMLSGHPPFYDCDPMRIYQKIVNSIINFPDFFSLRAKDLIRKLLNPNIESRLGCQDDGNSIKNHKWFKGVNWDKIYHKQIPSPWMPQLKSKDDVSYFEKYPESKDKQENPTKEIQKLFVDF